LETTNEWRDHPLTQLVKQLQMSVIEVDVIHPNDYPIMPLPTYPEIPFTMAHHTQYPEYSHKRFPIPTRWKYHLLK